MKITRCKVTLKSLMHDQKFPNKRLIESSIISSISEFPLITSSCYRRTILHTHYSPYTEVDNEYLLHFRFLRSKIELLHVIRSRFLLAPP